MSKYKEKQTQPDVEKPKFLYNSEIDNPQWDLNADYLNVHSVNDDYLERRDTLWTSTSVSSQPHLVENTVEPFPRIGSNTRDHQRKQYKKQ